jgi:rod shape-determining protein MreC
MTRYTRSMTEATAGRGITQRKGLVWMLMLCAALVIVGRSNNEKMVQVRAGMMRAATPVLEVFSAPADAMRGVRAWWHDLAEMRSDNAQLRIENDALKHWQSVAVALEAENKELRAMVGYRPVEQTNYIAARVIAYNISALGHNAVIDKGSADGVRAHQAVIGSDGMIGRTTDVAQHSAHVLLLTDMNARIPVIGTISREKAMLVGAGVAMPELRFVSTNTQLAVGELLVTSDDGAVLPAGIAVGAVFSRSDRASPPELRVRLTADASRQTYVRVVTHATPFAPAVTGATDSLPVQ